MVDMVCPECGNEFAIDADTEDCPECGFGPESCSHPIEERDSENVYSVDEGRHINRTICGKCGVPVTAF